MSFFSGGFGSIVEDLKAKAQSYVGQMLMNRQVLLEISVSSPNEATQAAAIQLLEIQSSLETQLGEVNTKINSNDLSMVDYASILSFFYSLTEHLDNVDALNNIYYNETGKLAGSTTSSGISAFVIGVGTVIAVVSFGLYKLIKR